MLYLFENLKRNDIFEALLNYNNKNKDEVVKLLINFALEYTLDGDILKKYIIFELLFNKNPYTLSIERGDVYEIPYAISDLNTFNDLYNISINEISNFNFNYRIKTDISIMIDKIYKDFNKNDFISSTLNIYKKYGIGNLAVYRAFRVNENGLLPIKNVLNITFDDIIGYSEQKKELIFNTESFINGKTFNNVLLYGDSGCGKSSSIKALLNEYYDKGLRVVEIYKHEMKNISKIIDSLKDRPYYFIIYMDDLSFEENEVEYKYLKSVIEGGIEEKPNNVCIYATSNRRHLIKETFKDNGDVFDDLHRNETQAEKLSLAYRFGLQIYYGSLTMNEFKIMVKKMADKEGINIKEDILYQEAVKWELRNSTLSGRCAKQFISYIKGAYND